jgi:hypothetical protein
MKLAPIVDQLKTGGLANVSGALEFAGLKGAPSGESFWVVPEDEDAAANGLVGSVGASDQLVTERFNVVIVMPAAARNSNIVSDRLEDLKLKVIGRVAGWTHPDGSRACEFAGGKLLYADGTALAWAVRFRTAWRLRKI